MTSMSNVSITMQLQFVVSLDSLIQRKFQKLMDTVSPAGATVGVQAALRQIAYESLTVAVATIRQTIEQPDEALKKFPAEEEDLRLQVLKLKITGFEITHEYGSSHSTLDQFTTMLQDGSIKILPLSKRISQDQCAKVNGKKMRTCYNYNLPHGCHLETNCSHAVHSASNATRVIPIRAALARSDWQ